MGTAASGNSVRSSVIASALPSHSGPETAHSSLLDKVQAVQRENILLCAEVSRLKLKTSQLTKENQTFRSELERRLAKKTGSLRVAKTDNKKLKEELERVRQSVTSMSTSMSTSTSSVSDHLSDKKVLNALIHST